MPSKLVPDPNRKAWRIATKAHDEGGFSIVSERCAGRAKTLEVYAMRDGYDKATHAWITSCRRAPEFDALAKKYKGTIAWHMDGENWEQDRGHWRDREPKPLTYAERCEQWSI